MSTTKPTPNYGTIPTTSTPATAQTRTLFSNRRPWRDFLSPYSFSLPTSYPFVSTRIRRNLNYFRYNYSLTTLIILFLSLLFHPISIIVFLGIFLLWLVLYFSRDAPVVVLGRTLDDRVVLVGLFVVTVVGLVFTKAGVNVWVALVVAVMVVGLHAAFRGIDDFFLDDEGDIDGSGLVDVVEGQALRPTYARVV